MLPLTRAALTGLRWRRRAAGRSRQAGSVSLQMVVLLPALFAVMFLGMQAALFYHARTVAIAAAEEGARAAGARGGTVAAGTKAAGDFVATAGGEGVLKSAAVSGSRTATTATVTITGQAMSVIPGWAWAITQSATMPVERLST